MALTAKKKIKSSGIIRVYNRSLIQQLNNQGFDKRSISRYVNCHISTVVRWLARDDIKEMPRSGRPPIFDKTAQLSLIGFYCQTRPFTDSGRWTIRFASAYLQKYPEIIGRAMSKTTVHRILGENNLKPHRSKYFLHITDPCFFPKMYRLINLYNNPPQNLYCFDECPGIQILQRLSPDLRTEKMKIWLEEFEYIRHGTTDVFAFQTVSTGKVYAECRSDHKKETLIEVFENHLQNAPEDQPLHYIMDNLNSHSCYGLCQLIARYSKVSCPPEKELDTMDKRREWLMKKDKRIVFYYTPFHGSWLNQVEYWFGILNAKCLHESFNSPNQIYNSINGFVDLWNNVLAKPTKWKYTGEGLHEKTVKRFLGMLHDTEKIESKLLVKQLKLSINMANDYWDKIPLKIWGSLYQKVLEQQYIIKDVILKAKKKKPEKDLECLEILKKCLKQKLSSNYNQAA